MGCGQSKLEDLEAVALCRRRTQLLDDAIHNRFALANAHNDYSNSLRSVGSVLKTFLEYSSSFQAPPSPVLNLPSQRKGDPLPPPSPSPLPAHHHHLRSRSHSGSHIHFHSDSEDDSDSDADGDSPIHHHLHHLRPEPYDELQKPATTTTTIHYARNRPASSTVSYEQQPMNPELVQHYYTGPGDPSSSSGTSSYPPPPGYSSYYPPPPSYSSTQNQGYYPSYPYSYGYGNMGNFFGSASLPPAMASPPRMVPEPSKPPPPMPSPPRNSAWDFLNPFDYNFYQRAYTPSRSSKEVREEEGIPELEDEEEEVVKEAYGAPKFAASSSTAAPPEELSGKAIGSDSDVGEDLQHHKQKSTGEGSSSAEGLDGDVVDKNVVADDERRPQEGRTVVVHKTYRDTADVAEEIKAQFERVSDNAGELAKMLEVGKQPYHQRASVYQASKMICMLPPSTKNDVNFLDYEEEKVMGAGNLSSTLQKVYIWESKLYEEVKVEEKMRVLHERQCKRLKHLDARGAEAYKLDATQAMIRKLSTKIRIAIQIVESISKKIDKLWDDELWPQINELIEGFMRMWKAMLECHRTQCHAISEAKSLTLISAASKLSDNHMDIAMRLELELLQWIGSFSAWVVAQKNFVKSLNDWLLLCLQNKPVETDDGYAPFSPGRIGAPPIFVICNYWSQIMNRISEREVLDAMQSLESIVRHLWEHSSIEQRQRLIASKDVDGLVRNREREAQRIQKEVESLNKKLVLVSRQSDVPVIHQAHSDQSSSLQVSLKQIFEAMESFASNSVKAYEELLSRGREEIGSGEESKVS